MGNRIEVRTDIIEPHTYLEIELNYRELLDKIHKCGGYALFQQIYKYFNSKSKGFREIKKLEELLLVGSEQFNNNKYIYLKITALKYLKYRYVEDLNEMKINRIINKPGFRPIMNSVYSLEYLILKHEYVNCDTSLNVFEQFINQARQEFIVNRIANIHLGRVIKKEYVEMLKTKLKILGDRNGIYLKNYEYYADFKKSNLNFVWFDFQQSTDENPILRILKLISKFLNNVGTTGRNNLINCCNFSLEIVTISNERRTILESLSKNVHEIIDRKNNFYLNSSIKLKENHVISNVKNINYQVFTDIEGYLRVATRGESEFSFINEKVVDRLEILKQHLEGEI